MRGRVIQRGQIVLEPAGNQVKVDTPPVKKSERRNHLRHRIRVHIDWLDSHKRTKVLGVLNDDLGHQPGIDDAVVRVDQNPFAAALLTPARHIRHAPRVAIAGDIF